MVSHYNVQPVIDVYASTQGRDLGGVASDTNEGAGTVPASTCRAALASSCAARWRPCSSSFLGLGIGLLMAIVLVYFLIVVNFQSWLDPFIIITALPGALAGICWILLLTRTTLSVPSLTGAVMCMGVATANSILMVSFARDRMDAGVPAAQAALEAGYTRIRPVLMTALAMIIGMVPMSLGLGEGGEQNAPLGRAVIGGLLFATVATLFFVPSVFAHHSRTAPGPASRKTASVVVSELQQPDGHRKQQHRHREATQEAFGAAQPTVRSRRATDAECGHDDRAHRVSTATTLRPSRRRPSLRPHRRAAP